MPLATEVDQSIDSWEMLGTNLSVRLPDGGWKTESERLMLMDQRDFNKLGLGLDDLIECYIQTILAMTAIDKMAQRLLTQKNKFRRKFFLRVNPDPSFVSEVMTMK